MDRKIVIFSGMPASGKDTVTERICELDAVYTPLKKYRSVGAEDKIKDTYFNISKAEFEEKISKGDFLQYHERYGRYYGIAEETLYELFEQGRIPIIHIGRIENFYTLCRNLSRFEEKYKGTVEIIHILLWETKETLIARITDRDKTTLEIEKRKAAMEQEFSDNVEMMCKGEKPYTYIIKNSDIDNTCKKIFEYVEKELHQQQGYEEFYRYIKE